MQGLLDDAVRRSPPLEATDHLGTVSRLWSVTDQRVLSQVTGFLGPKPVFIADGHHRYETALRYLEEWRAAGDVPSADAAANYTLMMLVGMSDPGLLILPTHRLVSGLPPTSGEQLRTLLGEHFLCETVGSVHSSSPLAATKTHLPVASNKAVNLPRCDAVPSAK